MDNTLPPRIEVDGYGQLVVDKEGKEPPVSVRYIVALSAQLTDPNQVANSQKTRWEWSKAEGYVQLIRPDDRVMLDVPGEYILILENGQHCRVNVRYDPLLPKTKYRIECSVADFIDASPP